MSLEHILVLLACAIALISMVIAVIAVRIAKKTAASGDGSETVVVQFEPEMLSEVGTAVELAQVEPTVATGEVQVLGNRVIVTPSSQQIVAATMGRPLVRLSVALSGLSYATRGEARDRIRRTMRAEYRARKNIRRRAAKRAAKSHAQANSSAPMIDGAQR